MLTSTDIQSIESLGAAAFIYPAPEMVVDNVFKARSDVGYKVTDEEVHQIMLNMPLEIFTTNKHRFGMFLELFRFLYDLLSMHLSIRKGYFETFLAKSRQFEMFFDTVKDCKKRLHGD